MTMDNGILILWDIDGTLVLTGGAGERALVRATKTVLGHDLEIGEIDWAGRTDRRIAEMILEYFGRPVAPVATEAFVAAYLDFLPEEMPARQGEILPGITELVTRIAAAEEYTQGLLTGNMERGARIKLGHFDLWHHFPFGAFADDGIDRNSLGPRALEKAATHRGAPFAPERVFIVGDTPHDIACGHAAGVRTVAVATGKYPAEALKEHGPTALFEDLADTEVFLDRIAALSAEPSRSAGRS